MVRVGNDPGTVQIALSTDGGITWSPHAGADTTKSGGTVALSADGDTVLWSTSAMGVWRSTQQGAFAAVAAGATSPPAGAVIASDKRNSSVFYAGADARLLVSTDGGATFAAGGALAGAAVVRDLAAHPAVAAEVWASTDKGLFRSTDYGATFTAVGQPALTSTFQLALGRGAGAAWTVYAFGTGPAGNKLYASADTGATWSDVQGTQGFGAISSCKLAGSGNVAGQVYVGTNGRGVFHVSGQVG